MEKDEKLLLIDTTRKELLVALVDRDTVEKRTNADQRRHSVCLNDVARDFIPLASAFAVVVGPGSWTGSRVGVVAVKAWSLALERPVISLISPDDGENRIDELIKESWGKFHARDFTDISALAPLYDSEFKVGKTVPMNNKQ